MLKKKAKPTIPVEQGYSHFSSGVSLALVRFRLVASDVWQVANLNCRIVSQ